MSVDEDLAHSACFVSLLIFYSVIQTHEVDIDEDCHNSGNSNLRYSVLNPNDS